MINALVYHGDELATIELPTDRLDLRYEMLRIGIFEHPAKIPINDDKDRAIQVKSSRLIHLHTIFFCPFTVHVHLRYGVLHSPQTSSSVIAYLLEYLPCSVFVPTCLVLGLPDRLASSSWTLPKVTASIMAGWLFST